MTTPLFQRILQRIGAETLLDVLETRTSPSELQTLMLELYRRKASGVTPRHLLREYERNRFVRPTRADVSTLRRLEGLAVEHAPAGACWIELSPVTCLGASSAVGPVDQHKVLSTIRNTEVISDVTNAMALECAIRRRARLRDDPTDAHAVRLVASHRMLRTQRTGIPGPDAHFRMIGLCSAGRSLAEHRFVWDHLYEHIEFYVAMIESAARGHGLTAVEIVVAVNLHDPALRQSKAEQVLAPLRVAHSMMKRLSIHAGSTRDIHYYQWASFQIAARVGPGRHTPIANGGLLDWTQQLLSNRKERLLASGLFLEQLAHFIGRHTDEHEHDTMTQGSSPKVNAIEIDGNDGTGKSTLVGALARYGIVAKDRGRMTKATDDPTLSPQPGVRYILLDTSIASSQQRLLAAGKDLNERYHREEDLIFYRERFSEVAVSFGAETIDATSRPHTLQAALSIVLGRSLRVGVSAGAGAGAGAWIEHLRRAGFDSIESTSTTSWRSHGWIVDALSVEELQLRLRVAQIDLVLTGADFTPPVGLPLVLLGAGQPPGLGEVRGWGLAEAGTRADARAFCDTVLGTEG